ncbi:MAG: DNA-binding protein [Planctomycetota bacterium]|nr:MAG: DNA-binding protein [Planctomycetota bacterium]
MSGLLSPKQVATAIGASESSLKRWCDQGLLATIKTAGGHRRISLQEALRFVREQNHTVVEPQLLSLPSTNDRKSRRIEECADRLTESLLAGCEQTSRSIVLELFVAGHPVSQIFDEVVAPAFRAIGEQWECHQAEVYQERAACQVAVRILNDLRSKQVPTNSGRLAIGATIEGDHYSLPTSMAEIVLHSVGWDARLLGSSIPLSSMEAAVNNMKPGLLWLSVSHIPDEAEFIAGFNRLFAVSAKTGTAVVVGGRALTTEIRTKLRYSAFCDTMGHLEEFAKTVLQHTVPVLAKPRKPSKKV